MRGAYAPVQDADDGDEPEAHLLAGHRSRGAREGCRYSSGAGSKMDPQKQKAGKNAPPQRARESPPVQHDAPRFLWSTLDALTATLRSSQAVRALCISICLSLSFMFVRGYAGRVPAALYRCTASWRGKEAQHAYPVFIW